MSDAKGVRPIGKPMDEKYEGTKPIGKPNPEKNRKAIFANEEMDQDVTFPPDPEMFEQEDQTISYPEKSEKVFNFRCGGMGKAYKGGKFIGCK